MGLRHPGACVALLLLLAAPARGAPAQEPAGGTPPPAVAPPVAEAAAAPAAAPPVEAVPPAESPAPDAPAAIPAPPPPGAPAPSPAPAPTPPACQTSLDCGLAALCLDGTCVAGCRTDRDCPPEASCDAATAPRGACVARALAPAPAPDAPATEAPAPVPSSPSPAPVPGPATPALPAAPAVAAPPGAAPDAGPGSPAPAGTASAGSPPDPAPDPQAPWKRPPPSLQHETATLGSLGRLGWRNRVAALLGADLVGQLLLLRVMPGFDLTMPVAGRPFSLAVGIPLRFQLVDAGSDTRWAGAGRFRTEDWNRPGEYLQFLQDFTWGGPGHDFLFRLTQHETFTLGRGALVRRLDPNVALDTHRVSVLLSGFSDWAGGEAYLDDLAGPDVVAARAYVAPLAFLDRERVQMRTLRLGASVAADVSAPLRNRLDVDDADDDGRRWTEPLLDPDSATPRARRTSVLGWGFDLGLTAIDTGTVAWDTWVDYSLLQSAATTDTAAAPSWEDPPAQGVRSGGFTFGHLLRADLPQADGLVHGLRLRLEYRNHDPHYLPGYFDPLYGVQRWQYGRRAATPFDLATAGKAQRVLGRDPDGTRPNGMLLEFTYLLGAYLDLSFGFEFNDRTPDNHLFVHLAVPDYKDFQFSATWHRRSASGAKDLFRWLSGDGADLFVARARYTVSGIFGICLEAMTPFGMASDNTWENQWQVGLSIDLGWSYDHLLPPRKKEAAP